MANFVCQLHWDEENKEVVKTYTILSADSRDHVTFTTSDADQFIIRTDNKKLAERLGLEKVLDPKNSDLYQVKKSTATPPVTPKLETELPDWLKLECGTLEAGKFKSWGGVGPDGF
jgi:hypothetical protein